MRRLLPLALVLVGCGAEELVPPTQTAVLSSFEFARETDGVSIGMNLDGFVSETNDGRSCFKEDFVGPDGTPGIDNEIARLLPLVDLVGENALEALIQNAIDEGTLLIVLEISENENGHGVTVLRGEDRPLLGTDGRLLEGQTLGLHAEPLLGATDQAATTDGIVTTEPFELNFPIVVFSQLYEVFMPRAQLRFRMNEDGGLTDGLIAGGIPVEQLLTAVQTASNFAQDFEEIFGDAIRESGDLDRDNTGNCNSMSVAVSFEAVPAFTF